MCDDGTGYTVVKVYRILDDKPRYTKKFPKKEFSRTEAWGTILNADPPTREMTGEGGRKYVFTVPHTAYRNAHLKNHWRWKIVAWECAADTKKVPGNKKEKSNGS